jgi:ATP-dependent RNA helicase DDX56/DBP9
LLIPRKADPSYKATTALILAPTRELCDQLLKSVVHCTAFCAKDVQAVKLTDKTDNVQRSILSSLPDIVICTPAKAWQNIESSFLRPDQLSYLVLDEADLLLGYGHTEDLSRIAKSLPKGVQNILTSATFTPDVDNLKGLFCRNPIVLDIEEPDGDDEGVAQYVVK